MVAAHCLAPDWRMLANERLGVEGSLHRADAQAGFGGDLRGNALRAMTPPVVALAFNRDILTRLNICPRFQQLSITPNMLVTLFFRQA